MYQLASSAHRSWTTLLFCLVLMSCGSAPRTDYDNQYNFAAIQRYYLESRVDKEQRLMETRIAAAIGAGLDSKGLTLASTAADADILVRYSLAAEQKPNNSRISIGLGSGSYGGRGGASIGGSVSAPIGQTMLLYNTIQLDMIDAKSGQLIWRGSDSFEVKGEADAQTLNDATRITVDRILGAFPPDTTGVTTNSTIKAVSTDTR
jgi:hypothetical protein